MIRYCRECGAKLRNTLVNADKVEIHHNDSMGGTMFRLDNPFNEKTGERNVAKLLQCPKWKKSVFNHHDKFIKYEGDEHYL